MNKKALPFLSTASSAIAALVMALPSSAQIGIDIGSGSSIGFGGIPGIDASPWPSRSIAPGTVGGGRASVIPNALLNGTDQTNRIEQEAAQAQPGVTQGNLPGMPTDRQAYSRPTNRQVSLPQTAMNLMGPESVDMSPIPSAQWKYGFPNSPTSAFRGVSGGGVGGFLPAASTASVDLNTYDGPSRVPLTYGQVNGIPNINFGTNIGGIRVGGSVNPVDAYGAVQNFFGP